MTRRAWTTAEVETLRARWASDTAEVLAEALGRTPVSIYRQASRLGLRRVRGGHASVWTEQELDVMRRLYRYRGAHKLASLLPGRTLRAIQTRAKILGLYRTPPWTGAELALLRREYAALGARALQPRLAGRSYEAIVKQARHLGLVRRVHAKPRPWTPAEDAAVLERYPAGEAASDLAADLQRTEWSVIRRACRLGVSRERRA